MNNNEATVKTATEYRLRVRCNSCFKRSWVTAPDGFDVNRLPCALCGEKNAVAFKFITIRAEKVGGKMCAGPCQSSKSGDCECSCGGKNHGVCA